VKVRSTPLRVLDWDIENMPVTYYAPDYPTALVTAIAWAFVDTPRDISVRAITDPRDLDEYVWMLAGFKEAYDAADIVTGHYILKHDLPIVNGALIEMGMESLGPKLASDTKMHLVKYSALPKNQEFLEAIFKTTQQKLLLTQYDWRRANRFLPDGVEIAKKRVVSDVRGHMQMRRQLVKRGLLKAPVLWKP